MRLLLVEDSRRLQESIARGLRRSGFAVDVVGDGNDALNMALSIDFDVIILDILLPGRDGLSILRCLREQGRDTNVLLLTASDTVDDRVRGLRAGADDYLIKPFAFDELLARIETLARRRHGIKHPVIVVGDLSIDTSARTITRGGVAIELTAREFALLEHLAHHRGRPVSRTELEQHIYDGRKQVMSNAVDSAVCSLRAKLAAGGSEPLIHTRRSLGYVLEDRSAKAVGRP